jgi:hypothetical protein
VKGKRVCRLHGARAGPPSAEKNGSYKHGGWTDEAIGQRRAARRLLKQVQEADVVSMDEVRAKMEQRKRQHWSEREPFTREEAQAIMAYCEQALKAKGATRAERRAANKAAWAAGDQSRWGGVDRSRCRLR